jgi:hypothetical protein
MAVGFPTKVNYATGDVLSATNMNDLSGTVNLLESAQYAAGKNKIINGDFGINQRNFTSNTANGTFNFDRFYQTNGGSGTLTITPQTFTAGTAPVAGYEATNFVRCITATGTTTTTYALLTQKIEDVRTFAGQTVTVSFWAKAASGTPKLSVELQQEFGTGGSTAVNAPASAAFTLSTSWVRYSTTIALASISGKTIGTGSSVFCNVWFSAGSDFNTRANSIGIQNGTFDTWGWQVEAASSASVFQTATGTKQGELAACQRYYTRWTSADSYSTFGFGNAYSTTAAQVTCFNPVSMRVEPTSVDFSTLAIFDGSNVIAATSCSLYNSGNQAITVTLGGTLFTAFRPYALVSNFSSSGYIGFSAEL